MKIIFSNNAFHLVDSFGSFTNGSAHLQAPSIRSGCTGQLLFFCTIRKGGVEEIRVMLVVLDRKTSSTAAESLATSGVAPLVGASALWITALLLPGPLAPLLHRCAVPAAREQDVRSPIW